MKPEVIAAINKSFSSSTKQTKEALKSLKSNNSYPVDTVVRLRGDVVVGKDSEKSPTTSLLNTDFLLLVLKRAGVTRDAAMSVIADVAGEYLQDWKGTDEDKKRAKIARENAIKEYDPEGKGEAVFQKFTASLPKIPVRGSIKFDGIVEEIAVKSEKIVVKEVV